jgi:hypothetical protein
MQDEVPNLALEKRPASNEDVSPVSNGYHEETSLIELSALLIVILIGLAVTFGGAIIAVLLSR